MRRIRIVRPPDVRSQRRRAVHNGAMESDVAAIQVALAELSEPQLQALINAAKPPQIAPGLLP